MKQTAIRQEVMFSHLAHLQQQIAGLTLTELELRLRSLETELLIQSLFLVSATYHNLQSLRTLPHPIPEQDTESKEGSKQRRSVLPSKSPLNHTGSKNGQKQCHSTSSTSKLSSFPTAVDHLKQWLAKRGIQYIRGNFDTTLSALHRHSVFIGKYYEHLQDFLNTLKRHIARNQYVITYCFNTSAPNFNPNTIGFVNQLCRNLTDCNIVQNYHYNRKSKLLKLTLSQTPEARAYLNGQWLELYIQATILGMPMVRSIQKPTVWVRNLHIRFSDGYQMKQREIDFFLLIGNTAFCFEAKTGDWAANDIQQYKDTCLRLNMPSKYTFLVLTEAYTDTKELSHKHQISICRPVELKSILAQILTEINVQQRQLLP